MVKVDTASILFSPLPFSFLSLQSRGSERLSFKSKFACLHLVMKFKMSSAVHSSQASYVKANAVAFRLVQDCLSTHLLEIAAFTMSCDRWLVYKIFFCSSDFLNNNGSFNLSEVATTSLNRYWMWLYLHAILFFLLRKSSDMLVAQEVYVCFHGVKFYTGRPNLAAVIKVSLVLATFFFLLL